METKVCGKCKRVLPTSEFSKCTYARDGLQYWCKECHKANNITLRRARIEANKLNKEEQEREQEPKTKVCSKCKRELPLSAFFADASKARGVHSECKECYKARRKERKAKAITNTPKNQNQMTTNFEKLFSEMIQKAVLKPIEEMLKTKFENLPSAPAPVQAPPKMKVCDCCGREKPESDFVKGNDKIGLHNLCKDCSTILASNTRGEWGEGKMKCPSCGAVKPKEEFCFESDKFYLCADCHDAIASNPYLYYPTEKLIQELKALKDEPKHS